MTLKDHSCYAELGDALREVTRGKPVAFIGNSGNWGDALIQEGQRQLFRDHGIRTIPFSFRRPNKARGALNRLIARLSGHRAIIQANGAYYPAYDRFQDHALAARFFRSVLLLPSSLPTGHGWELESVDSQLWRRDQLESAHDHPPARFCHDLAFYLDPEPREPVYEQGCLFRNDRERSKLNAPAGNRDISLEGTHKTSPQGFLDEVGRYRTIHTDRLHVGIAGALLNREVHLYPIESTMKIQSIFASSLAPHYPNVYLHQERPAQLG